MSADNPAAEGITTGITSDSAGGLSGCASDQATTTDHGAPGAAGHPLLGAHQPADDPEPDDEVAPLRHTGHLLRRAQQVHLAVWNRDVSTEITSVQYATLSVLERRPGVSQADLGTELFLDRSTIADLVSRMANRGLLTREQDPADRRRRTLTLTAAGRDALADLRPRVDAIEPVLTAGLDATERADLRRMLRTLLAAAGEEGLVVR